MEKEITGSFYEYADIVFRLEKTAYYAHIFDYVRAAREWDAASESLTRLCRAQADIHPKTVSDLWETASTLVNGTKGIADAAFPSMIEEYLLPAIKALLSETAPSPVQYGDWTLVPSSSGYMTLRDKTGSFLHSTSDPLFEAFSYASKIYDNSQPSFHILGMGLGYLPYELWELSEGAMDIYVYESDADIINAANDYGMTAYIPSECLHIITDTSPDRLVEKYLTAISERTSSDSINYTVMPWFERYLPEPVRRVVYDFTANYSTMQSQYDMNRRNFLSNLKNIPDVISKESFPVKERCLVIAAGPSLDSCIDYIKSNRNECTLFCATTIYRKLLTAGIVPDYVCVLDPQLRTFGHLNGVENFEPTLIAGSDACWKFAKVWTGPKCFVPVSSVPSSIGYFEERGMKLFSCSGTVASLELEAAAFLGAKQIELIGVDLSFPNGMSHASGTMDLHKVETNPSENRQMTMVRCTSGGEVPTSLQFLAYARQLEKQISNHKDIKFINHSKTGIYIEGCVCPDAKENQPL